VLTTVELEAWLPNHLGGELRAGCDAQFHEDVGDVSLDRATRYIEALADLRIGEPFGD
jgi:hypothetical protein